MSWKTVLVEQVKGAYRAAEGLLELVEDEQLSWKPESGENWMTVGQLLNHMADERWTEMPEDDQTPCPLLGEDGACLIYEHRPMICRTHGLPNIDISGESFSNLYCSLNFSGCDPLKLDNLRWPFRRTFLEEFDLLDRFTRQLLGFSLREADTFIPLALLIDFSALAKDPSLVD